MATPMHVCYVSHDSRPSSRPFGIIGLCLDKMLLVFVLLACFFGTLSQFPPNVVDTNTGKVGYR